MFGYFLPVASSVSIILGKVYTRPTGLASSKPQYWSPLAIHGATTSGVINSSPPTGESSTQQPVRIRRITNSRRHSVTEVEGEIVGMAEYLMLQYTLFDDPIPDPVTLTVEVHRAWSST